jgi:hypothetical protein
MKKNKQEHIAKAANLPEESVPYYKKVEIFPKTRRFVKMAENIEKCEPVIIPGYKVRG